MVTVSDDVVCLMISVVRLMVRILLYGYTTGVRSSRRLEAACVEALALCQAAGTVSLGQVALDGTKTRANASRRKAMSYARMSETEKILADEVSALLADAERIDKAEDKHFGNHHRAGSRPDARRCRLLLNR